MIGLDTSFLVAYTLSSHTLHTAARNLAERHAPDGFALASQVLTEFLHVATDARRFTKPLSMDAALDCASRWWAAREVRCVFPDGEAATLFTGWMREFGLGRKRVLDTMLAATYVSAGAALIATSNWRDFSAFPGLHPLVLGGPSAGRKFSRDDLNER